ncbi:MaoC family dehydratase [Zavarzinia sp. CC-PAN008]|uniref:MaoC family dehydratase n=1 Tax=Zavarzinia sp. CC-PAN008 TaxID=3243332 RepID=UPI003F74951F
MQGPTRTMTLDEVKSYQGKEIGTSDWFLIDQNRINAFADITEDHMFLHVNPEMAAKTPFGSTIAHGLLTLSMMPVMAYQAVPGVSGTKMGVNYGYNRVRFMAPVKVNKRIRGKFTVKSIAESEGGKVQIAHECAIEIEGEDKPALLAEWVTMVWI